MKLSKKETEKKNRELLLKVEFNSVKGDKVIFKVDKNTYTGIVVDLIPEHEYPSDYFIEEVPDSRNKCAMWQDENGNSINSVLLCEMTGKKKNLPVYHTSINIIRKINS